MRTTMFLTLCLSLFLFLLIDNHMYRHIRNGLWAISFTLSLSPLLPITKHCTSMSISSCDFDFSLSSFLFFFYLSSTYTDTHAHTQWKRRYGGNYWRIIECWHIVLISCLLMIRLECDRFMQQYYAYIYIFINVTWTIMHMNILSLWQQHTRHNVFVV